MTPSELLADPQYYTFLETLAKRAAHSVARKFRTPVEDMAQEALMWCLTHPEKFLEYWADEDQRRGERYISAAMKNACRDYAVQEQVMGGGADGKSRFWYRNTLLEDLLRQAWDKVAEGDRPRIEILDVQCAVEKQSAYDQWLLKAYYYDGVSQSDLASAHADHISQQGVGRALKRALGRVHAELGGRRPHNDPPEPGWQDHVGSRKAISNAHARAITSNAYDA